MANIASRRCKASKLIPEAGQDWSLRWLVRRDEVSVDFPCSLASVTFPFLAHGVCDSIGSTRLMYRDSCSADAEKLSFGV